MLRQIGRAINARVVTSGSGASTVGAPSALATLLNPARFYSVDTTEGQGAANDGSIDGSPSRNDAEASVVSASDPQRALFDRIRSDPSLAKFTYDETADPAKERYNYNRPGTNGQQPMQDT